MKHSIRLRLVVTLACTIGCTILLCWIMNKTFLPAYYKNYKIDMLGKAYERSCVIYGDYTASQDDEETDTSNRILDSELSDALESLGANNSMSLFIFQLYSNQVGMFADFIYPSMDVIRQNQILDQINSFTKFVSNGQPRDQRELISKNEKYQIVKVYDRRMESYYLELLGTIDDSTWIYIRSNYQSMLESVAISNQFLAYMGIVAILFGILVMYVISKSFTKPILELSEIANKMSHLEFDEKYKVKTKDEIGILGDSINLLSERLEETISELKSANNELQKDIEKKTQIDEMRTEFLSNVSHELKTPIALIQGYAEGLMENVNEDEESRKFYCEVITDEACKMNNMVKKLLSLNHIEFGENPLSFTHFDIVTLIRSVLSSTEILFEQKEAVLYMEDYEPIYVWADEYMIQEVVTNYVSNALNHVSGEKIIEIKLIKREKTVRVAVFNTGVQIPEGDLEKVWEKFYKVDKARTREYGGSGIGLSIVKAIMESHHQKYGVCNHENGVEFWFELDYK